MYAWAMLIGHVRPYRFQSANIVYFTMFCKIFIDFLSSIFVVRQVQAIIKGTQFCIHFINVFYTMILFWQKSLTILKLNVNELARVCTVCAALGRNYHDPWINHLFRNWKVLLTLNAPAAHPDAEHSRNYLFFRHLHFYRNASGLFGHRPHSNAERKLNNVLSSL